MDIKEFLLTKANRLRLAQAFRHHLRVDMSIDCAIEGQMGKAYVDDEANPTAYFLELSGFFGYFAGDAQSSTADALVQAGANHLVMPSGDDWSERIKAVHGDNTITIERFRYDDSNLSIAHLDKLLADAPQQHKVERFDVPLLNKVLAAEDGFVDIADFESPEDFVERGVGFCVQVDDTIIGVAYSSLVCSRGIEISIVVHPDHHRQGIATALACHLVKHCLERGQKPNWDAANAESDGLAQKLGYTFIEKYKAFYIKS